MVAPQLEQKVYRKYRRKNGSNIIAAKDHPKWYSWIGSQRKERANSKIVIGQTIRLIGALRLY
jgi:hypothetical protein